MWAQISLDLSILTQLLRLLRWAGRIKQDITLWATTLGQGLAQELNYVQVGLQWQPAALPPVVPVTACRC